MKALVMHKREANSLELRNIPIPQIDKNDVLVEVKAAAICGSDIHFWEGRNAELLNTPVVLGHEFSGIIAKKGKMVEGFAEGDRVVSDNTGYICGHCEYCLTGQYVYCKERRGLGYGMDGGFAEYVKISAEVLNRYAGCLLKIPNNTSFEEASIIEPSCNAYRALFQDAQFLPGATVVIFGPGAIGLFCVQLAAIGGAGRIIVVGTYGDERRLETAEELGADNTVLFDKETEDSILDMNGGDFFDLAIDAAGPPAVTQSALRLVRRGGQIVKIGMDPGQYSDSLEPLVTNAVEMKGHFGYDYTSWKNVLRLLEGGKLDYKKMISNILPLDKWKNGFQNMKEKKAIKVVLSPS